MKKRNGKIVLHLALIVGITAIIVLCMVYPFLPGMYDSLAMALSMMAQLFGAVGLLLVPIGALWFGYELWKQARRRQNLPVNPRRYSFALASVIASSIVMLAISLVALATVGISFAVLTFILCLYIVSQLIRRLRLLKNEERERFNFMPLYLILIPIAVLLFQLLFADSVTQFSRNYAIAHSAEFINDIEAYHAQNGRYPNSLLAIWKDYYPSVVGIEKFHYWPNGDAYNLFFEQPRFLFDNIGTREFVVYNPRDEQVMISHTAWILLLSPQELQTSQGWYAVHNAATSHWKQFWFD
jgi:hypothetical protein